MNVLCRFLPGVLLAALACVTSGCGNQKPSTVIKLDPVADMPKAEQKKPVQQQQPAQGFMPGDGTAQAQPKKVMPNQTARGRIYRVERQNELRNIGQFFNIYATEFPPNQRNLEGFKAYIKRDSPPIHEALSEGYYIMNFRAQLNGTSVVAYESLADGDGYMAVFGDGRVEKASPDTIKASFGQ